MEVKCVGTPGSETDDEVQPVAARELGKQADGVLEGYGPGPFCGGLAVRVGNDDALLPDEEVLPRLAGGGEDALCDGIGGLVG